MIMTKSIKNMEYLNLLFLCSVTKTINATQNSWIDRLGALVKNQKKIYIKSRLQV